MKIGYWYFYKGNKYYLSREVKMKDPTTRKWVDAYLYVSESGTPFVRSSKDFESKFCKEKVNELLH